MASLGPGPETANSALIARVKAILLSPLTEWPRIEAEQSSIGDIYRSYVLPLAAIGPVARLIGSQVFGYGAFGFSYRPPLIGSIVTAVVSYIVTLVSVYLLALVIDMLAPQFGATPNRTQAFKVAAYGATAGWIAGIFGLIPMLSFLAIVGLYSLYLIYLGLPVLMKVPADKATPYTIVVIVVTAIASLVIGAIAAPVAMLFAGPMLTASSGSTSGVVTVPGAGSVDLGKLEAASQRMQNGQGKPVIAGNVLQGLLPTSLPGLARTSIESSSAGAAGLNGSQAEAHYGSGENEIVLRVTDMGALGGLTALGGALNVESSKQTATGYERVGKVDGRMTTEKYDSADKRGSYSTIVGDRIMVEAEGSAPSGDAFKAAVASVDLGRVATLAGQ